MSTRIVGRWAKVMAAIAAAASPIAGACGGQIEGGEASSSSGQSGTTLGGPAGSRGSSSGTGASSGTSSTSGSSGCGKQVTAQVPWDPPRCTALVDEAGAGGDADVDGGTSSDPAVVCETEREHCYRLCDRAPWGYSYASVTVDSCTFVDNGGTKTVTCRGNLPPCGRAHEGLAAAPLSEGASAVARWLEHAAYLEDASVTSFELLASELEAHGAPRALVGLAKKSARDEVRHARVMSALAQRHGGRARRAAKVRRRPRPLESVLRENAVEGCVHETYGAQLAWYQAMHASDPKVKAAMTRIAEDETRHAALAWQIARWGEAKLDDETRASIVEARAQAWGALEASLGEEPEESLAATIGLPPADAARAMAGELRRARILAFA